MVAREIGLTKDAMAQQGFTHPVGHVATPATPTPTPTPTPAAPPTFNYSFVDNGGYSTVVLKVSNMQAGWKVTATVSGAGLPPTEKSGTYGGQTQTDGNETLTWNVGTMGTYSVTATVTDSDGKTVGTYTGSEYVT